MKSSAIVIAAATLILAGPALAGAPCTRPTAPAPVDGATATLEQVMAAKGEVSAFMTASDTFQSCVLDDATAQKAAAKASKTKLDPAIAKAAEAQIEQNQADKVRVGRAFNTAAKAYRAAHPS